MSRTTVKRLELEKMSVKDLTLHLKRLTTESTEQDIEYLGKVEDLDLRIPHPDGGLTNKVKVIEHGLGILIVPIDPPSLRTLTLKCNDVSFINLGKESIHKNCSVATAFMEDGFDTGNYTILELGVDYKVNADYILNNNIIEIINSLQPYNVIRIEY